MLKPKEIIVFIKRIGVGVIHQYPVLGMVVGPNAHMGIIIKPIQGLTVLLVLIQKRYYHMV